MSGGVLVDQGGLPCIPCSCLVSGGPRRTEEETLSGHRCVRMSRGWEFGQPGEHVDLNLRLVQSSYWHSCTGQALISLRTMRPDPRHEQFVTSLKAQGISFTLVAGLSLPIPEGVVLSSASGLCTATAPSVATASIGTHTKESQVPGFKGTVDSDTQTEGLRHIDISFFWMALNSSLRKKGLPDFTLEEVTRLYQEKDDLYEKTGLLAGPEEWEGGPVGPWLPLTSTAQKTRKKRRVENVPAQNKDIRLSLVGGGARRRGGARCRGARRRGGEGS